MKVNKIHYRNRKCEKCSIDMRRRLKFHKTVHRYEMNRESIISRKMLHYVTFCDFANVKINVKNVKIFVAFITFQAYNNDVDLC